MGRQTKASAMKESIQETPYTIQTKRDEQEAAVAGAKQPAKLSAKTFFGKEVPIPEPHKALAPYNWVADVGAKRGKFGKNSKAKQKHEEADDDEDAGAPVQRGPPLCRGPVEFLVKEELERSIAADPELKRDPEHLRHTRKVLRAECMEHWKNMKEEDRKPYQMKADADRERFRTELAAWKAAVAATDKADANDENVDRAPVSAGGAAKKADKDEAGATAAASKGRKGKVASKGKAAMNADAEEQPDAEEGEEQGAATDAQGKEGNGGNNGKKGRARRGKKAAAAAPAAAAAAGQKGGRVSRAPLRWAERQRKELLGEDADAGASGGKAAAPASKIAGRGKATRGTGAKAEEAAGGWKKAAGAKATPAEAAGRKRKAPAVKKPQQGRRRKAAEVEEVAEEEVLSDVESGSEDEYGSDDGESNDGHNEDQEEEVEEPKPRALTKRQQAAAAAKLTARGAATKAAKAAWGKKVAEGVKRQRRGAAVREEPLQEEAAAPEVEKAPSPDQRAAAPAGRSRKKRRVATAPATAPQAESTAGETAAAAGGRSKKKVKGKAVDEAPTAAEQLQLQEQEQQALKHRGRRVAKVVAVDAEEEPFKALAATADAPPKAGGRGKSANLKRKGRSTAARGASFSDVEEEQRAVDEDKECKDEQQVAPLSQKRQSPAAKAPKGVRGKKRPVEPDPIEAEEEGLARVNQPDEGVGEDARRGGEKGGKKGAAKQGPVPNKKPRNGVEPAVVDPGTEKGKSVGGHEEDVEMEEVEVPAAAAKGGSRGPRGKATPENKVDKTADGDVAARGRPRRGGK